MRNTGTVRSFETWPPPGVKPSAYYLHKGPSGSVTSLNDGALDAAKAARRAAAAPAIPIRSRTGCWAWCRSARTGPDPARAVLTFTSKPLSEDVEIAGSGRVIVYASTTRDDIDLIVKVSSSSRKPRRSAPRACSRATSSPPRDGSGSRMPSTTADRRRGIYRTTAMRGESRLTAGKIYKVEVPLEPIAYRFRQGQPYPRRDRVRRFTGHRRAVLPPLSSRQDRRRHDLPRCGSSLAPGAAGVARLITAWSPAATGRSAGRSSAGSW